MYGPFGAIERSEFLGDRFQAVETWPTKTKPAETCGIQRSTGSVPSSTKTTRQISHRRSSLQSRYVILFVTLLRPFVWVNDRVESQLRAWRWGHSIQSFSLLGFLVAQVFFASTTHAAEPVVRFDVPALIDAASTDGAGNWNGDLMEIRLTIPVTTEIGLADRENVNEFRYDIRWQHADYPVVDFGPRTKTTSTIEGSVGVETRKGRNATFGLGIDGGELGVVGGSAKAEAVKNDEEKIRYQEIPQHDVLVASGTVDRGTGAFFRFHRSRQETLEGSRELSVSFRVPSDWQAGLLEVKCQARGERKVANLWSDPIETQRSFTLPVYLANSLTARDRVVEYVRAERGVEQQRARRRAVEQAAKPPGLESVFRGLLGIVDPKANRTEHGEPQSRVVRYRVPVPPVDATGRYRNAREELLRLSR